MSRWPFAGSLAVALGVLLAGSMGAQQPPPTAPLPPDEDAPIKVAPKPPPPAQSGTPQSGKSQPDDALPPDEDAASAAANEKVAFNPVQSKFVSVGDFYFKKNDFKAATQRYRDATRYNDANAEAWLKLGEAEEKRGSPKSARPAYEKYLQLAPNAKNASEIKKRLDKLN
jgi:tetratricopeptide (TPR) repeat protein